MCCLCVLTSVDIIGIYKAYSNFQLDRPPVLFSPSSVECLGISISPSSTCLLKERESKSLFCILNIGTCCCWWRPQGLSHIPPPLCIISYNLTIIQERYTPDCLVLLPLHHHSKLEFKKMKQFPLTTPIQSISTLPGVWIISKYERAQRTFFLSLPCKHEAILSKGNIYWCVCVHTHGTRLSYSCISSHRCLVLDAVRLKLYSTFFVYIVCLYLSVSVDRFHLATTTCVRSPADSYCFLTGLLW